jgi:hypothetical protein
MSSNMRKRWAVIFNCQSEGLASSVDCLAREIDCSTFFPWDFKRIIADEPGYFRNFDFAVVSNEIGDWAGELPYVLPPHIRLPSFQFSAFHPDSVYVFAAGKILSGKMSDYHSMIALAAYKEGLCAERAATFFNRRIFEVANYFDTWVPAREALAARYREAGFDIAHLFVRAARHGPFMHTVNHPKIEVLFEIARLLLKRLDQPMFDGVEPPPDKLAGLSWPIYPEIGEQLGLPGSYLFKPAGQHKPLELVPFLTESLTVFEQWDRSQLRVIRRLQRFLQEIRAEMRSDQ